MKWRVLSGIGVVTLAGIAIGLLLHRPAPPAPVAPPPPRVELAGQALDLTREDPVADGLDLVRRYATRPLELTFPDGSRRRLRPDALGAELDRARLGAWILAARNPESALRKSYEETRRSNPEAVLAVPIPIHIDRARSLQVLLGLKGSLDRLARDAAVDLDQRKLVPERVGYFVDVYGTLARVDTALRAGATEVEAAVEVLSPRVKASDLQHVEFEHVLGYFETRYDRKKRARSYNLHLAASRFDGTVLLPGEVFDFNRTVGPRDEANGYKVAPVIAEGELVDGIGGGTCQVSGTLHGAAFFAGLEIVERVSHSRPSSYIKLGMDAAVAYPKINFKVRNNFDFPVVLHETVKNGRVRAEILGPERKRTVSFFRRIDEVLPFEVEERPHASLPRGKKVLGQRGIPGFRAKVFRVVREGVYAYRDTFITHYPPTQQIVLVGTGEAKKAMPKRDRSDEYRAAEQLVITQGPGVDRGSDLPGGAMVENRTKGKTGVDGWQKKWGLPVFEDGDDDDERDES
ncbi:MAG: VanW family protein [Myxococcota bacterium]